MGHNGSPYNDVIHVALIAHNRTSLITSLQSPLDLNDPQELFFPAMTGFCYGKKYTKYISKKHGIKLHNGDNCSCHLSFFNFG